MKKVFMFLFSVLFAVTVMANEVVMHYEGGTTTNMKDSINNAELVSLNADTFYVRAYNNDNTAYPGLNKDKTIRLYSASNNSGNGSMIEITLNYGVIDSVKIEYSKGEDYTDTVLTSNVLTLQNTNLAKSQQVWIKSITIYYTIEDVPTGLYNLLIMDGNVYSLYGMKVDDTYTGIVIQNGKKFYQRGK